MKASQIQKLTRDSRPKSGTLQTFKDVPLTPFHNRDTSGGFTHEPLEHEIVASESVWDVSVTPDELIEDHVVISTKNSRQNPPAGPTGASRESFLDAVVGPADLELEVLRDLALGKDIPKSAVLEPGFDLADLTTSGSDSAEILVEGPLASDTRSGLAAALDKENSWSTESPGDQSGSLFTPQSSSSDELSLKHGDKSEGPSEPTISTPSARVLTHSNFPRAKRPTTPVSIPESFDIPIPIFPFPAGKSRCKDRDCPIKIRHEQGPYLHEGKLRTREGSIFGASNPPPEIWFLYDRFGNADLQGVDSKPFAPVELFVKYHFGETRVG